MQVDVHPFDWSWNDGQKYAWREHPGRGYWQNGEWQIFIGSERGPSDLASTRCNACVPSGRANIVAIRRRECRR